MRSVYRTPPASFPPPPDPLFIEPDRGLRALWVGRASPEDVLRVLGEDCQVNRYDNGDIFGLDYAYEANDRYAPTRDGQTKRPCHFAFEFGVLKAIRVDVYQVSLYTTGKVRIGSSRADVLATFGDQHELLRDESLQTLRYRTIGIELALLDEAVSSFTIFRALRQGDS